jgi:hypothetical protein
MKKKCAVTAVASSFALFLGGCASSQIAMPVVPDNLVAPSTQSLSLAVQASGVQIYQCAVAKTDPTKFEWRFIAPEAELFDGSGKKIGKHYAGPTWESLDGSKVVGAVKAQNDGPDAGAIPWLLLSAKSHSGSGVFGPVQTIQRLNTVGGKAPADGCDQAQVGKEARVAYQAQYRFYSDKSS